MKKLIFIVVFLAVTGVMVWLVWLRPVKEAPEQQKPEADVPVHVGKIVRTTLRDYAVAYGFIESAPKASAKIAPSVPGVVASVKCAEGQQVESGAILFQLESRAADVAVEFAEKIVERQKKLAQLEGTSQKALQDSEQQLATARAQQAILQIRSPLSGVVSKVNVKAGEAADLTTVLAEVVNPDLLVATFNLSSADLVMLKAGQPTEVMAVDSTNAVNTTLTFASPQMDPKTGSGLARAALPPHTGLHPGQMAKGRIIIQEHKNCLAVPLASVAKQASGGTFIAVVDGEKATLKPVKLGLRNGALVEIEGEGLAPDTDVVTDGAYGLIMTEQFATKIRVVNE
ncbi:MAG TPA: efflux RND transporter periplasmic adaptor subunit [Verrucomicrobiae bacterium]|jgi:RND family efflux transporter MFP subunit